MMKTDLDEAKRRQRVGKKMEKETKDSKEQAGDEDQVRRLQLFLGLPLLQRGRGNSGTVPNTKIRLVSRQNRGDRMDFSTARSQEEKPEVSWE